MGSLMTLLPITLYITILTSTLKQDLSSDVEGRSTHAPPCLPIGPYEQNEQTQIKQTGYIRCDKRNH